VTETGGIGARVAALDWPRMEADLAGEGFATTGPLLSPSECAELVAAYDESPRFRSRVVMERHGYGRGEYQYFGYPLPAVVAALRDAFYRRLTPVANRWMEQLGADVRYPAAHDEFLARCHAGAQTRPTPLLLRYGRGDHNRLHRDLYGDIVFPLQLTVLLSAPGADFEGGEFVLTSSRPRSQTRADVVRLAQGEGIVFAVRERPERGQRGWRRVEMRHGVSLVLDGRRHALGVIFHDAA
jgi:hypothetical protein